MQSFHAQLRAVTCTLPIKVLLVSQSMCTPHTQDPASSLPDSIENVHPCHIRHHQLNSIPNSIYTSLSKPARSSYNKTSSFIQNAHPAEVSRSSALRLLHLPPTMALWHNDGPNRSQIAPVYNPDDFRNVVDLGPILDRLKPEDLRVGLERECGQV